MAKRGSASSTSCRVACITGFDDHRSRNRDFLKEQKKHLLQTAATRAWGPRSVAPAKCPEQCGPSRPTRGWTACHNALFVLPLDLEREVPFVSHLRDLVKLRLEPVDMLLLVLEERREQLA